jgi:hypothetical protein
MAGDIDIDHLTIDELVDLNERVVERIKYLERLQVFEAMQRFNLGHRVTFDSRRDGPKAGVIAKFNQKSVTVLTDDGYRYNIAPGLLTPEHDTHR